MMPMIRPDLWARDRVAANLSAEARDIEDRVFETNYEGARSGTGYGNELNEESIFFEEMGAWFYCRCGYCRDDEADAWWRDLGGEAGMAEDA